MDKNKILLIVVGLLILGVGIFAFTVNQGAALPPPKEGWISFHSTTSSFSIYLPGEPVEQTFFFEFQGTGQSAFMDAYRVSKDDAVYIITALPYPEAIDISDAAQALSSAFDDIMKANPTLVVQSKTSATFMDQPSLDYLVTIPGDQPVVTNARMFLKERMRYSISATYYAGAARDDDVTYFMNSFRFAE